MIYEGDVLLRSGGGTDKHREKEKMEEDGTLRFAVGGTGVREPCRVGSLATSLS